MTQGFLVQEILKALLTGEGICQAIDLGGIVTLTGISI